MVGLDGRIKKYNKTDSRLTARIRGNFSQRMDDLERRSNPILEKWVWNGKRRLDKALEAALVVVSSVYGIEKLVNYTLDLSDKGDRTALAITAGSIVSLVVAAFAEYKTKFVTDKLNQWYQSEKQRFVHWTAVTGTAALFLSILARIEYPIIYSRIMNPPAIRQVEYRPVQVPIEYVPVKGIPPGLDAEIYWMTRRDNDRKEMTRQIRKFEREYKSLVEKYYNKYLAKYGRISIDDIFGLISTESKMNPFAVSGYGAGGLTQLMHFVVEKRINECGGGKLFITENIKKGRKTGDKNYYREYAKELKSLKAKYPQSDLAKHYAAFDPEKNICMGIRHLKFLLDKYPNDNRDTILLKYNTNADWVDYISSEAGTKDFGRFGSFFRQKESKEYPYKVRAAAHIYRNSPNGIVREPNYYRNIALLQSLRNLRK